MISIYLDNNATTRPADEVVEAMTRALREDWANPSSVHRPGQSVRRQVELARTSVAELVGCLDREVVFTSGGTESANLAIRGALGAQPTRRVLVTSRLEHSAVRELAVDLESQGAEVIWLGNDELGIVDVDALRTLLRARADEVGLVSIMWVNNETGVMQPVERIGGLCREFGVRFHTDATQYVGKLPMDVSGLPVDLLGFAAHKFHGPKGIGALYVRRGLRIRPQIIGGPHERQRRGGTENAAGIVGFGVAADLSRRWLASGAPASARALHDAFERELVDRLGVSINGGATARMWDTSNVAFTGLEAEPILLMLSERGVCASAGAACSSGSLEPSAVLRAMGLPEAMTNGSIRFSISRETTQDELDRAVGIIVEVIDRLRAVHIVV